MMKHLISALCIIPFLFSLSACGKNKHSSTQQRPALEKQIKKISIKPEKASSNWKGYRNDDGLSLE